MALTSAIAYYGLQGTFPLTSAATSGTAIVGPGQTNVALPTTGQAWAVNIEVDGEGEVEINLESGATIVTSAPVAQVETATAVGTIGTAGNALVTVTGAGIVGSPLAISVPVSSGDSAATWAGKVRDALNATAAVVDVHFVGGGSTAITLSPQVLPKPNDITLNIALANGTCTGITAAPTSVNTTAGVAASKCERLAGVTFAEDDAEGKPLVLGGIYGFIVTGDTNSNTLLITSGDGTRIINPGEIYPSFSPLMPLDIATEWTFTAPNGYAKATLVVITA